MLTFGGGNDNGANEFVLSTLLTATPNYLKFLVISGSTNPNNNFLKKWILLNGGNRVDLLINPKNVAKLYSSCDQPSLQEVLQLMKLTVACSRS